MIFLRSDGDSAFGSAGANLQPPHEFPVAIDLRESGKTEIGLSQIRYDE
jgi:hypothetical protein